MAASSQIELSIGEDAPTSDQRFLSNATGLILGWMGDGADLTATTLPAT